MNAALSFAELRSLIGARAAPFKTPCPLCGPSARAARNKVRPVLKIWPVEPNYVTYSCVRCGVRGWASDRAYAPSDPAVRAMQERAKADAELHTAEGEAVRIKSAFDLWTAALRHEPGILRRYFASRALAFPESLMGPVLRFAPALWYEGGTVPGMIALMRDIRTDCPCAIQRTFFGEDGRKLGRKMLGKAGGAAIKVDANDAVTEGLVIGEGLESVVAARQAGLAPAWALGSAGAIAAFPVLSGIEALTILAETDDSGANARAIDQCGERWLRAGREVTVIEPKAPGDMNDVWREAVA